MAEAEFIDVPIRSSRMLAVVFGCMHAAAIAAVSVLPVPWSVRLTGSALLLASAAWMLRRYALLLGAQACSRIRISNDGICTLDLGGDRVVTGRLQPGWLASPLLIVTRVRCPGERLARKVVLLPDSSDAETLRRIRIFLRFTIPRSTRKK